MIVHTFIIYLYRQEDSKEYNKQKTSSKFITHALFIDSTWNQSNGILKDPIIRGLNFYLKCIILYLFITFFFFFFRTSMYKTSNKIISILETSKRQPQMVFSYYWSYPSTTCWIHRNRCWNKRATQKLW